MVAPVWKFATSGNPPREVAPRVFRFIASTATRDRAGDIVEPSGWALDAFRANPVVLISHDNTGLPVARAVRIEVTASGLVVDIEFPPEGMSRGSDEALGLVRAGYLKAMSVCFRPLKSEPLPGGGRRYIQQELLEVSLVAVPANAGCLVAARYRGTAGHERARRAAEDALWLGFYEGAQIGVQRAQAAALVGAVVETVVRRELGRVLRA